ncbi:MAG: hypothetical protein ACK4OO_04205 [bacterium]
MNIPNAKKSRLFPLPFSREVVVLLGFILSLTPIVPIVGSADGRVNQQRLGDWSGEIGGEFTRRYIQNDLVYFRRGAVLMGRRMSDHLHIWGEGGLTSIQLLTDGQPLGAWGPSFYLGWAFSYPQPWVKGVEILISARAGFNQSKLAHDKYSGLVLVSRRSRYEWWEGWGIIGAQGRIWGSELRGGLVLRKLLVDEFRSLRSGAALPQKTLYSYDSGFQPGVGVGFDYPLGSGWELSLWGDAFAGPSGRLVIGVRQWSSPGGW